jgi:ATP-binding cassette, subfamily B, bacterial
MMLRLYDQVEYEGRVLVDDVDIKEWIPSKLRRQIMLVDQNSWMFNLSVRDNITLGVLGFTKKQIEHAAQVANAHEFIMKLPRGYSTVVGNGGKELSFSLILQIHPSHSAHNDGLNAKLVVNMIV